MTLPDRRPTTSGQPTQIAPTAVYQQQAAVAPRVVWVPDPFNPNQSVAVPAEYVQAPVPYQPRDLTPQPVLDPVAQRIAAAGVGGGALAAGVGWGTADVLGALPGAGSGIVLLLLVVAMAAARRPSRTTTITNHNHGWFGRNTTNKR